MPVFRNFSVLCVAEPVKSGTNSKVWMKEEMQCRFFCCAIKGMAERMCLQADGSPDVCPGIFCLMEAFRFIRQIKPSMENFGLEEIYE